MRNEKWEMTSTRCFKEADGCGRFAESPLALAGAALDSSGLDLELEELALVGFGSLGDCSA